MKKVIYTSFFLSLFLGACNTNVETQIPENKSSEDIVAAKNVKIFTIEELHYKVKETRDEINQLDQQIDKLLKGI